MPKTESHSTAGTLSRRVTGTPLKAASADSGCLWCKRNSLRSGGNTDLNDCFSSLNYVLV